MYGAQIEKADWNFAGRSETSRRTITASVTTSGFQKMIANWIYKAPDITEVEGVELAPDLTGVLEQRGSE